MKQKCVCCRFDNCRREFIKHKSHTAFSALNTQFTTIADLIKNPDKYKLGICDNHANTISSWLDEVFKYFDSLAGGVLLPKMRL